MKINFFLIFFLTIFICSCKNIEKKDTPATLYKEAFAQLKNKDYLMAAESFEKIDSEFPFNNWAIKGQVMATYAYYNIKEYDKSIQLSDDFIKLYPNSEYIPYMMYMKALSYYNKIQAVDRSQENTKEASAGFREIIAKYSKTDYADDAKNKVIFIDEHLAGSKISLARYYINEKNYIGAIKNLDEVINRYRNSKQVPESYYRLAEIFFRIGAKDLSNDIAIKLLEKYPNNYWTKEAKKFTIIN